MKKRLRKKLHRGEFQEFGFGIAWQFMDPLDADSNNLFFDAMLEMVSAKSVYKKAQARPPSPNNGGARGVCGLSCSPIIGG